MRITYSEKADALAIELVDEPKSVRTQALNERTNLDFDADGRLVLIEVIGASEIYPRASLAQLAVTRNEMPLAQAAKESGLAHNTLRLLVNQGKLKATKRGTDWFVEYADVLNYMERRQARGRPAKRKKARRPKAAKA